MYNHCLNIGSGNWIETEGSDLLALRSAGFSASFYDVRTHKSFEDTWYENWYRVVDVNKFSTTLLSTTNLKLACKIAVQHETFQLFYFTSLEFNREVKKKK